MHQVKPFSLIAAFTKAERAFQLNPLVHLFILVPCVGLLILSADHSPFDKLEEGFYISLQGAF